MKKIASLLLALAMTASLYAQDTTPTEEENDSIWTVGGNTGLFFQQVGLKNWAGGGEDALAYGGEVNLYANKFTEKHTWNNTLQAGYGLVKIGDANARKNNDVLMVNSQYGRFMTDNWQLAVGLDFRTQFANGYIYGGAADGTDSLISTFLAPGYATVYIGATYKPNEAFSATLSPLTEKVTIVSDDELAAKGAYGVDPGENVRWQTGWSVNTQYQKEIMTNVNLKTALLLFGDYEESRHVDVNFDLFLNFKVNKYITTNFSLQAIYDHDIKIEDEDGNVAPRTQLRNVLNIGVVYNFGDPLPK